MITKEQKLETLFHLKHQLNHYIILKRVPWQLVRMETRLNRRLNTIFNKMINNLLRDPLYTGRDVEEMVRGAYGSVIPSTYHQATLEISKLPGIDVSSAIKGPSSWGKLMEDRTFKASERTIDRMTGDVLGKMREHVTDGKSQDKTIKELSNELRDMKRYELQRITKTETHSIYMEAKQDLFNKVDVIVGKEWVITGDNTRPWHEEADGQVVPFDEPFSVMDEELMYPGDMDGSAENVINCYCNMNPVKDKSLL